MYLKFHDFYNFINCVLAGLLFCLAALVSADEVAQTEAELAKINAQLKSLQRDLRATEKAASAERAALEKAERALSETQAEMANIEREMSRQEALLDEMVAEIKTIEQRLDDKKDDMAALFRLAYKQNSPPLIKLLLNGGRPEDFARHLYYLSALTDDQQAQLALWQEDQMKLNEASAQQEVILAELDASKASLLKQQSKLAQQNNNRQQALSALVNKAANTQTEIAQQEQAREEKTAFIEQLKTQLEALNLGYSGAQNINDVKSQLPWPIQGRLTNTFGRSINASALKWQGWVIVANAGAPVRAIHGGRVVFAEFFKSTGLLIILDHGNNVWSLYGRNRALLAEVGTWVSAGDVIAEVGQSGGYQQSGLYFEIRVNGAPSNPARWLSKQ